MIGLNNNYLIYELNEKILNKPSIMDDFEKVDYDFDKLNYLANKLTRNLKFIHALLANFPTLREFCDRICLPSL